jgi:hypothetical protein
VGAFRPVFTQNTMFLFCQHRPPIFGGAIHEGLLPPPD